MNMYLTVVDSKGRVFRYQSYKIEVSYKEVTAVAENNNHFDLNCFPNPSSDFITLTIKPSKGFEPSESSEVQIFNALGEQVMLESINPVTDGLRINIESLPKGIYFVKAGGETTKFVKM